MSPAPDDSHHELPYPHRERRSYPDGIEQRVSALEGWRGSMDEWRRGMDAWRGTIEREGLVTAVAVIGTRMEQINREVGSANQKLDGLNRKVEGLESDKNVRRGVTLTGRTAALFISAAAGLSTVIALLIALLAGAGAS